MMIVSVVHMEPVGVLALSNVTSLASYITLYYPPESITFVTSK